MVHGWESCQAFQQEESLLQGLAGPKVRGGNRTEIITKVLLGCWGDQE